MTRLVTCFAHWLKTLKTGILRRTRKGLNELDGMVYYTATKTNQPKFGQMVVNSGIAMVNSIETMTNQP